MKYVILMFGFMIVLGGIVILFRPALLVDTLSRYSENLWLQVLAVVARLLLGIAMVFYADLSRFPLTLQVLGCIFIAAAIFLAILPRKTFQRLIARVLELFPPYLLRPWGILAMAAGGFLMWCVT